jgi:hypothetical protein
MSCSDGDNGSACFVCQQLDQPVRSVRDPGPPTPAELIDGAMPELRRLSQVGLRAQQLRDKAGPSTPAGRHARGWMAVTASRIAAVTAELACWRAYRQVHPELEHRPISEPCAHTRGAGQFPRCYRGPADGWYRDPDGREVGADDDVPARTVAAAPGQTGDLPF